LSKKYEGNSSFFLYNKILLLFKENERKFFYKFLFYLSTLFNFIVTKKDKEGKYLNNDECTQKLKQKSFHQSSLSISSLTTSSSSNHCNNSDENLGTIQTKDDQNKSLQSNSTSISLISLTSGSFTSDDKSRKFTITNPILAKAIVIKEFTPSPYDRNSLSLKVKTIQRNLLFCIQIKFYLL
jgi:hypothetical protein